MVWAAVSNATSASTEYPAPLRIEATIKIEATHKTGSELNLDGGVNGRRGTVVGGAALDG
jgi:hypothetical protein